MRKITFIVFLILLICLGCAASALAAPTVILNGEKLSFDAEPIIEDGATFVPLSIFTAMGFESFSWDGDTQAVMLTDENSTFGFTIRKTILSINNGDAQEIDMGVKMADGETLVPLRFVCETLGGKVEWEGDTQTITITFLSIPKLPIEKPQGMTPDFPGYIGNMQTHTYHRIGYECIGDVTMEEDIVLFNTIKEAEAAGYEPCELCDPTAPVPDRWNKQ